MVQNLTVKIDYGRDKRLFSVKSSIYFFAFLRLARSMAIPF